MDEQDVSPNRRVLEYAKALAKSLGCSVTRMVSRQTDTGLMLVDLWPKGLTGAQAVISLEAAGLT